MASENDPKAPAVERDRADMTPASEIPGEQVLELNPEPVPQPSLLDRLAEAVGGRAVLYALAGALLLGAGGAGVGLFGGPDKGPIACCAPGPIPPQGVALFTPVGPSGLDNAIGLLMLADADKAKIRAEVQKGAMRIALITVIDNDAEDGDWVSISGAGFRQDVRLFHKPYTVAVPYLPGMPVTVTGLKDGGGGDITVTVMVGAAKLSLKPLKERETLQLTPP